MSAGCAASIEEVASPGWLSGAIAERYPGTAVTSVQVDDIVYGVAARARIKVRYTGPEATRLPVNLFIKGGFAPDSAHLRAGGAYYREARFYREVAPRLDLGVPFCLHASFDERSQQGIVVLEDLIASRAELYRLGDTQRVDTVARFLEELAMLHVAAPVRAEGLDWVPNTRDVVPRLIRNDPLPLLAEALAGQRGEEMPAAIRDPARILAGVRALMSGSWAAEEVLLHGDMHLGNIYTSGGGRPGWYDWQTLQRGAWAMDVVYYIVGSLDPEERRAHLSDLLRGYAQAVAAAGGRTIGLDEMRELYRRFLAYGLFIWSLARETIVPLATLRPLLRRFALAAEEAGTFAALGA